MRTQKLRARKRNLNTRTCHSSPEIAEIGNEDERFVFGRERKCRDWKMNEDERCAFVVRI
jgi:hypothetical protein